MYLGSLFSDHLIWHFFCAKNDNFLGFGEDWNDFYFFFDFWIKMIKVRLPGIWLWSFQRFQRFQIQGVQGTDLPVWAWDAWEVRPEVLGGAEDFMSGAS